MAELKTRIALKYDSFENWMLQDPVLYKGEIAIATIDTSTEAQKDPSNPAAVNIPNVVIKVGDGKNPYSKLKFVSGLAADVYEWAKAATPPSANTIPGIDEYIQGKIESTEEIQDTNTTYTFTQNGNILTIFEKEKGGESKQIATFDLTTLTNRVTALEEKVGNDTVANQISAKIAANQATITSGGKAEGAHKFVSNVTQSNGVITVETAQAEIADIKDLQTELDSKQDNLEIDGTVSEDNKVATQTTVSSAITSSLAGLTATETEKATSASEVVVGVTQANGAVSVQKIEVSKILPNYTDEGTGIVTAVNQVNGEIEVTHSNNIQDFLSIEGNYNGADNPVVTKSYVDDYVDEAVADLAGAMHFEGVVTVDPTQESPVHPEGGEWADGDFVINQTSKKEYVYYSGVWHELGAEGLHVTKDELQGVKEELQGEIDSDISAARTLISKEIDDDISAARTAISTEIDTDISSALSGLALTDTPVDGQFITKVTQTNGAVTVERAAVQAGQVVGLSEELAKKVNVADVKTAISETNKVVTESDAKTIAQAEATTIVNSLTSNETSLDEATTKVVAEVTQTNGAVAVKTQTLANVAVSGNVKDLVQGEDDLLLINCGDASHNITKANAPALTLG